MATYYFRNTGDVNWGTATNWSLTDGGGATGAVPTATDDALFTANSGNCTVNASARVCKTIDFTGYTNTITMTNTITVSGNVTLDAAMGIAGTSALRVDTTGTLTSNGKTWSAGFTFLGTSQTYTLADNWTISGVLSLSSTTACTINSNTIYSSGNLTTTTAATTSGTTNIELTGGTWSNSSTGVLRNNLIINGNITISGTVRYNTGTLTYTSGTVTTTGSTLTIAASTTLDTDRGSGNKITWNNITLSATNTLTLTSDLNINGLFTINGATTFNGTFAINCYGGYTNNSGNTQGTGTTTLNLLGGTITGTTTRINTNINGNITISGTFAFQTATLTYVGGNVVTDGSTIRIDGSCTLNLNTLFVYNISFAGTVTLTSDLNVGNLLTISVSSANVAGSYNINCYNGISMLNFVALSSGSPSLNLYSGTWSGSGNIGINTFIRGNIIISGSVGFVINTLTYVNGRVFGINNPTLTVTTSTTFVNAHKLNVFRTITLTAGITLTMNKFFEGTASYPTRVQASTQTGTYTVTFQDTFEKISPNVKVSGCVLSQPLQLLLLSSYANKGNNTGIRYYNSLPNGESLGNNRASDMIYGLQTISDPAIVTT